jgi:protein-tyrosine phosphatase
MTTDDVQPQRVLQLATGHNFRDIGGYPAEGGRTVKWRRIFRSGFMSRISGDDLQQLKGLGIDTICDFRANGERERHPTSWQADSQTELWARDYDFSAGGLFQLIERSDVIAGEMRDTMVEVYRVLPFEQADSYREMFKRIAAGRVPLVFNCSAGKDRTGVAAALLLAVLGVSRESIEADYLLTNEFIGRLIAYMENEPKYARFVTDRREHAMPLLRADADYLATSFDTIEASHGSVGGYLTTVLGVTEAEQNAIRVNLLDNPEPH